MQRELSTGSLFLYFLFPFATKHRACPEFVFGRKYCAEGAGMGMKNTLHSLITPIAFGTSP